MSQHIDYVHVVRTHATHTSICAKSWKDNHLTTQQSLVSSSVHAHVKSHVFSLECCLVTLRLENNGQCSNSVCNRAVNSNC